MDSTFIALAAENTFYLHITGRAYDILFMKFSDRAYRLSTQLRQTEA